MSACVLCVSMFDYEEMIPREDSKFHMKIVSHLNACTWDMIFEFNINFYFIKNNNQCIL